MAVAATKKYSLEEYAQLPDDGVRRELDEGELVTITFAKSRHTFAALNLYDRLNPWVRERGLGRCFMDTGFVLQAEPAILRGPDVAFLCAERVRSIDLDKWIEGSPDLAVEVHSPSETLGGLQRKLRQYLEFGSAVAVAVYPLESRLQIHRAGGPTVTLGPSDSLEIPELFPEWSMPIAELF